MTDGARVQAGLLVRVAIELEKEVEDCAPEAHSAVGDTLTGSIGYVLHTMNRLMEDVKNTKRRAQAPGKSH